MARVRRHEGVCSHGSRSQIKAHNPRWSYCSSCSSFYNFPTFLASPYLLFFQGPLRLSLLQKNRNQNCNSEYLTEKNKKDETRPDSGKQTQWSICNFLMMINWKNMNLKKNITPYNNSLITLSIMINNSIMILNIIPHIFLLFNLWMTSNIK